MRYIKSLSSALLVGLLLVSLPVGYAQIPEPTEETGYEPRQVRIRARGIEVFPLPERRGRLFALTGNRFQPFLAGQSDAGDFYYILYFERGELRAGWSPVDQLNLDDWSYEELIAVPILLPDELPPLPDLEYTATAERYRGFRP